MSQTILKNKEKRFSTEENITSEEWKLSERVNIWLSPATHEFMKIKISPGSKLEGESNIRTIAKKKNRGHHVRMSLYYPGSIRSHILTHTPRTKDTCFGLYSNHWRVDVWVTMKVIRSGVETREIQLIKTEETIKQRTDGTERKPESKMPLSYKYNYIMWRCRYYNSKDFKDPSTCFKYNTMESLK